MSQSKLDPSMPHSVVWLYSPSLVLAIIATILFGILSLFQFYLSALKYRSWYFIWVFVGALLETVGYLTRCISTRHLSEAAPYAIQNTLIIVAPLFIAAANYILLSRLVRLVLSTTQHRLLGLPISSLARIFVSCDIATFMIQATGAAIVAAGIKSGDSVTTGKDLLIVGLCVQVVTSTIFITMCWKFQQDADVKGMSQHRDTWMKVLASIYVSSLCIMVRTIYRLIEFALGIQGYPFTHEWIFYVLETLPMLPSVAVFCFFHPSQYRQHLPADDSVEGAALTETDGR